MTTVQVEPGTIDDLARMFDETNRDLVSDQPDWLGAWFTADRASSTITVIARWADAGSYERFRSSENYRVVMSRFSKSFVSKPSVVVNEILVEM